MSERGSDEQGMTEFDEQLQRAMRRLHAPEGFATRVVERARGEDTKARGTLLTMPTRGRVWLSGALAAGLALGVFGVGEAHVRRERERAERAQRQFDAGMRITDRAIDHAREQLRGAGVRFGD